MYSTSNPTLQTAKSLSPFETPKFTYNANSANQRSRFPEVQRRRIARVQMTILGDIRPFEGDEDSVEIDELARFAVDDYNKKQNALLEFVKVVSAKWQMVAGTLYYITLEANDGSEKKVYEAKVWEKPWMNFKQVTEFKLIGDADADADGSIGTAAT